VTVSAVVGAPLWGYIADAYGFRTTLTAIVAFDCMVKLFGIFCV
jgi:predicted MFS family arabinose efflux permease